MQYTQTIMEQGRSNDERILKQQQDHQQQPPAQRRAKSLESAHMAAQNQNQHHHHQPPPPQKCPRCDSSNTKFCYYNNYSLSQPRYFCKACRRYWTHGGTLRNVPVGGGCRKSKRPKPSTSSSSSGGEIVRTQSLSSAAITSQNLTGMISGQARPFPPVMLPPSIGGSFYGGGGFLSSLNAMQSLPSGINPGPPATANLGAAAQYGGANMALLQGLNLPSMRPPAAAEQFQGPSEAFASHEQGLNIPSRPPLSSWTQSFIGRGGGATSSSAAGPSFWSGAASDGGGDNQTSAGSSFNPNFWPDNHPGFDPSQ